MSIKDYFQYLYDHIITNLKLEPSYSTILTRIPTLCLNNTKSLGAYDDTSKKPINQTESLLNLLETILSSTRTRAVEVKLKHLESESKLDIEWLKQEQEALECLESDEIISAWLYYSKQFYTKSLNTDSDNSSLQKLLNILSHSLELNSKNELIWLVYLKTYLTQSNSLKDYYEICLLFMDNLITYDLI
jgi:hypothetical protein